MMGANNLVLSAWCMTQSVDVKSSKFKAQRGKEERFALGARHK